MTSPTERRCPFCGVMPIGPVTRNGQGKLSYTCSNCHHKMLWSATDPDGQLYKMLEEANKPHWRL